MAVGGHDIHWFLLAIKYPYFTFLSAVCELGVTLDQELTQCVISDLTCLVSGILICYYQLRLLRVVFRSLSPAAVSTLDHAFVVYISPRLILAPYTKDFPLVGLNA